MEYTVKGYWSIEGIFNGAVYQNNRKFGSVIRVVHDRISYVPSLGKDRKHKEFKRFLSENKLTSFNFLTEQIQIYSDNNPEKKVKLI